MERVSVIIPTLNRPNDLAEMLKSLLNQSRIPDEVIIVDQSKGDDSKIIAENIINNHNNTNKNDITLKYIRDEKITGAAQARNKAIELATGDIIFFFDDDVVLNEDFIKESLKLYQEYPDLAGIGGVITNKKSLNNFNIKIFNEIFCLGVFRDNRKKIFADFNKYRNPIYTNKLSGGCSSYKREFIALEKFDDTFDKIMDGYSFGEDIDLSLRIAKKYPLAITSKAQLVHNPQGDERKPHTRDRCIFLETSSWTYIFLKNFSHSIPAWLSFIWLCCGWLMRCLSAFFKVDTQTFLYFIKGIKCGIGLYRKRAKKPKPVGEYKKTGINVLGIGLDYLMLTNRNVRGPVRERQLEYAKRLGSLTLILYSPKKFGLKYEKWSDNLEIYPTNSASKSTFVFDAIRIGKKVCRERKIDVITTENPFVAGLAGYLLKRKFNIPLNVQTRIDFWDNSYWIKQRMINLFFNQLGKFIISKADTAKLLTTREKKKMEAHGIPKEKLFIIPTQCIIDRFKYSDNDSMRKNYLGSNFDKIILFVGRLVAQKDIPTLLRAFKIVTETFPRCLLVIAGEGEERKKLEKLAQEMRINDKIAFTGSIPHKELPKYYAMCDVFALPSIFEGICIVLAEAMASSKPVVTTNIAAVDDLVINEETGFIVECKDYKDMAEKILYLLNNEKEAIEMGNAAKIHINNEFYHAQNVDGVIKLWEQTANVV